MPKRREQKHTDNPERSVRKQRSTQASRIRTLEEDLDKAYEFMKTSNKRLKELQEQMVILITIRSNRPWEGRSSPWEGR